METITGKVVNYCDIPEELTEGKWFSEFQSGCYIECHISDEDIDNNALDELDNWLIKTYPGIEDETFFIKIDY